MDKKDIGLLKDRMPINEEDKRAFVEKWIQDYKQTDYPGRFDTDQKIKIFNLAKQYGMLQ